MAVRPFNFIELCAGAGGIGLGVELAEPGSRSVAFVEREAYAAATLVARMAAGDLAEAPVWSDLGTFDGKPWRGRVHCVTSGDPCQPNSVAGKRGGADDERFLIDQVLRVVDECRPLRLFRENVTGNAAGQLEALVPALEGMGYRIAVGIFGSGATGNSHHRERLIVMADAEDGAGWLYERPRQSPLGAADAGWDGGELGDPSGIGRCEGWAEPEFRCGRCPACLAGGELANTEDNLGRRGERAAEEGAQARELGRRGPSVGSGTLADPCDDRSGDHDRAIDGRQRPAVDTGPAGLRSGNGPNGANRPDAASGALGDTPGAGSLSSAQSGASGGDEGAGPRDAQPQRRSGSVDDSERAERRKVGQSCGDEGQDCPSSREEGAGRPRASGADGCGTAVGEGLALTDCQRSQGIRPDGGAVGWEDARRQAGLCDRADMVRSLDRGTGLWQPAAIPGPGDVLWASIAFDAPHLLPAASRYDRFAAACRDAGLAPNGDPLAGSDLEREARMDPAGFHALRQAILQAAARACLRGRPDALAPRVDRLRLCGNGVDPVTAAVAYLCLDARHRRAAQARPTALKSEAA